MQRMTSMRHVEPIGKALSYLTPRIRDLAGCDVFCGDPLFAGLHSTETMLDGRSYRNQAHVCFPCHVRDHRATVVLPVPESPSIILHELGHVVHIEVERRLGHTVTVAPVTAYAHTNRYEAFAEAFLAWLYPPDVLDRYWPAASYDRPSRELLDRLARGGW
jgi:hypothetical protein